MAAAGKTEAVSQVVVTSLSSCVSCFFDSHRALVVIVPIGMTYTVIEEALLLARAISRV